jgi:FAD-linked sulfhydryl oxidase
MTPREPLRTTKETHPNLPPGLILDAEGKVCKVCNSWQDWAKIKTKKKSDASSSAAGGMAGFASMMSAASSSRSAPSNTTESLDTTDYASSSPQTLDRQDCPADTALLGRSTWTFLHTTAAYYPTSPPPETQTHMRNLILGLARVYPCLPCAEDFQEKVAENPPDVSGRENLSRWLCERHNEVNEKLGKERFECDWSFLKRRWKDGPEDGRCD